jgi:hypothetical protein
LKFLIPLLLVSLFACNSQEPHARGKALAEKHCGSCHLPVSPTLLDKNTWTKHVLPAMAPKLGIGVWQDDQYYLTTAKNTGPVSFGEWQEIVAYYKEMAPDSLEPAKTDVKEDGTLFSIVHPEWKDTMPATTTMVSIHNKQIYAGSETSLQLFDSTLKATKVMSLESPATDLYWQSPDTSLLTCIGNLRAVDAPRGTLWQLTPELHTIALGLPRPVQTTGADFNKDGRMDYVVCGFGHTYGGLFLFEQTADGEYTKWPIWEVPGAIHAVTGDFNNDGWQDIMALFAYGDEGIWLFTNNHKGGFESKNLLRFPPVYGSTSFQLVDWNKDGKPDILYTCGDNADYSMILKPYHGVYIYLNTGNFEFKQTRFYPVNGCTKAIATDLDNDGDLDIATISFFADMQNHPAEKFIYFEQKGGLDFIPHAVPALKQEGRWICMEANDLDADGDIDIVLGNYSRGFIIQEGFKPDWRLNQPIILLRNNSLKK